MKCSWELFCDCRFNFQWKLDQKTTQNRFLLCHRGNRETLEIIFPLESRKNSTKSASNNIQTTFYSKRPPSSSIFTPNFNIPINFFSSKELTTHKTKKKLISNYRRQLFKFKLARNLHYLFDFFSVQYN